jgi:bifunctional DNA-binding transcriptional regulator/antitoxin component of YhaV-PrlF toxin-antitoxin module
MASHKMNDRTRASNGAPASEAGGRTTGRVGKRGTFVIPAPLRERYGFAEGTLVIAEPREDGVLLRPAIAQPLDDEFRERLLREADEAYAALRADPEAWKEELAERALWERTLMDGLDPDEVWTEDDRIKPRADYPDV